MDVFSFIQNENRAVVNFLKIINGAIVQSHTVELLKKLDESPEELLLFAIIDIRKRWNQIQKKSLFLFIPLILRII